MKLYWKQIGSCSVLCLALLTAGCGSQNESIESARDEVKRQDELRKSQVAEEAVLNADLERGEKKK